MGAVEDFPRVEARAHGVILVPVGGEHVVVGALPFEVLLRGVAHPFEEAGDGRLDGRGEPGLPVTFGEALVAAGEVDVKGGGVAVLEESGHKRGSGYEERFKRKARGVSSATMQK